MMPLFSSRDGDDVVAEQVRVVEVDGRDDGDLARR